MSQKTVMAVFDDRSDARRAVRALLDHGFSKDEVSLLSHGGQGQEGLAAYQNDVEPEHTASGGAATGGVLGGLTGLLLGLGLLTVPGVGPMVVAGPIASTLMGAATGAVVGGLMGVLMDFGVPEPDAHIYSEAVRRGSTIVAVTAPPERVDSVAGALSQFGPVDLEKRSVEWRDQGWTGFDEKAEPVASDILAAPTPFSVSNPSL